MRNNSSNNTNIFHRLYKDEEPSEEVKEKVMDVVKSSKTIFDLFELFSHKYFSSLIQLIVNTKKNKDNGKNNH